MKRAIVGALLIAATLEGGVASASPPPDTTLLGHKGAISMGVRNTLTSLNGAFEVGADGVEFDIVRTKDNEPVVLSDGLLENSTSNCSGPTTEHTYAEVRECLTFDGRSVPHLEEAIAVARDHRGQAWIHVKIDGAEPAVADRIVRAIDSYGSGRQAMVTAFGDQKAMLEAIRGRGVERIGLIFNDSATENWTATGYDALVVYNSRLEPEKIRAAQARGIEVVAVEGHPLSAREAIALGVDAVMMDDFAALGMGAARK